MTARLNLRLIATAIMLAIATAFLLAPQAQAATKDESRAELKKVSGETLARLYKVQPTAKAAIDKSAGYATFSNVGIKILVAGSGKGQGVAVNKKTGKETYMRMIEAQAGLGFGVKKFRLVWVFESPDAFDKFVNSGWELGTQATAAAKKGDTGAWASGAVSISPGVWLYQITDEGLALELTAKGTKYYKDDELN
jgi:lipid-binding SYLF domain-containing protein